jgi:hypothetical protein
MLLEVIARARRRLLWNSLAFHFAVALNVALGVLALLLYLGVDLLDWRWLVALPSLSLAAGIAIARHRLPKHYPTAQLVDLRLELADTLSTALYFTHLQPTRRFDEDVRRAQHAEAVRIVAGVDLQRAIPIRIPRAIYLAVLPAILAAGLLDVRYRLDPHLNLRHPMTGIMQQLLRDVKTEIAKLDEELQRQFAPDTPESEEAKQREAAADGKDAKANQTGSSDSTADANSTGQQVAAKNDTLAEEPRTAEREQQSSGDPQAGAEQNSSSRQSGGQDQKQQSAGNQAAASSDAGSSVVSRMQNSLANLLSALKPPPGATGPQQMAKAQNGRQERANSKQGDPGSDSASGQPGGDPQQSGSAQSAGQGETANAQADKQPGSGAGSENGAKEISLAEQLEAMGKLRVLLGKRSNSLTGEFTAQAPPGPQVLRTAYVKRSALHTDVHAKAQRDEVPLAFQEYVQRYFDMVQKANPSSKRPQQNMAVSSRRSHAAR